MTMFTSATTFSPPAPASTSLSSTTMSAPRSSIPKSVEEAGNLLNHASRLFKANELTPDDVGSLVQFLGANSHVWIAPFRERLQALLSRILAHDPQPLVERMVVFPRADVLDDVELVLRGTERRAIEEAIRMFRSGSLPGAVRATLLRGIVRSHHAPEGPSLLRKHLHDGHAEVREAAAALMGELGSEFRGDLEQRLGGESNEIVKETIEAALAEY